MKERLASKIYKELEYDILRGFYPVNTKLPPERELAERFKTSRFVIRESIAMLINAGLAETRPQSGTYIKNYFDDTTLDSLIRILQSANSMELKTFDSFMNYKLTNDVANIGKAAEGMAKDELDVIETLILKKKLNTVPRILAECDYMIENEIIKGARNIISLAISISLKPLKIYSLELLYELTDCRDIFIENDIQIFNALQTRNSKMAMNAMKERINLMKETVMKHTVVENGMLIMQKEIESRRKNKNIIPEGSVKYK